MRGKILRLIHENPCFIGHPRFNPPGVSRIAEVYVKKYWRADRRALRPFHNAFKSYPRIKTRLYRGGF